MLALRQHKLPPEKQAVLRNAVFAEWATLGFMLSIILVMYMTLGSSQAMRTAWMEDLLSLIPPTAFLISTHIARRPPDKRYPYGYHRAVAIAFVCGAVAVMGVGLILIYEGATTLLQREHPTIGAVSMFGHTFWLGWLMFAALTYSAIPPVLLGRVKQRLAREVHDKTLFADASMNRADWLTALAGILGVAGVGLGWWWADATAACVIALDVTRDGFRHLRTAITDLMDRHIRTVDGAEYDRLPEKMIHILEGLPWVAEAAVRLRDNGHVFLGEAFVVPREYDHLVDRIADASERLQSLDWRVHEVVVMPVREIIRPSQENGE